MVLRQASQRVSLVADSERGWLRLPLFQRRFETLQSIRPGYLLSQTL